MKKSTGLAAVMAVVLLGLPGSARAGVYEACGNVTVGLDATCEVEPPGIECQGRCQPLAMEVSCARELFTECKDVCKATIEEEEVTICSNSCVTECDVQKASFSCSGSCGAKCSGDCSAKCSASTNKTQCQASCEASCTGYCDVECKLVLPTMSCQEKCQQTCRGVVIAKVNMDCQLECHTAERYTNCQSKLTGGCQVDCQTQEGALFCDGQFVDYGNSLQQCIDALKNLKIGVNFSVEVSGCQMGGKSAAGGAGLLLLGAFGLLIWRRRRR